MGGKATFRPWLYKDLYGANFEPPMGAMRKLSPYAEEDSRRARRALLIGSPVWVVLLVWCIWELYNALAYGMTFVGPRGQRQWRTTSEDPLGFWFSIFADLFGLLFVFGLPLWVFVVRRKLPADSPQAENAPAERDK